MSDYEALLAEHKQLQILRDRLLSICTSCEDAIPEDRQRELLANELESFSGAISVHFGHEEQGGYFAEVRARRPELSAQIERLQAQHAMLVDRFADLARELRDGAGFKATGTSVRELLDGLAQHESAEDALLQDGMLTDISAND